VPRKVQRRELVALCSTKKISLTEFIEDAGKSGIDRSPHKDELQGKLAKR
jgi:hypothetical protein